eukprot:TRINITY_DN7105_c0_g1_i1.p1 TRINITY_DN7105_c0_g1~~TRINITY_DN7105_c0_g1_i1.p1  ORF type:complete len:417 (-),score=90.42 TRINITY_DN7105_c0_g1_i1:57-1307(-)
MLFRMTLLSRRLSLSRPILSSAILGNLHTRKSPQDDLEFYARFHPSRISIAQFIEFGNLKGIKGEHVSCRFISQEMPIRLANMLKELEAIPHNLVQMPSAKRVRDWYAQSFYEMLNWNDRYGVKEGQWNESALKEFGQMLQGIYERHTPAVTTMAQGILELKAATKKDATELNISDSLDKFYMNRIGIRMLISQHLELFESGSSATTEGYVGVIDTECDVAKVAKDAAEHSSYLCEINYGESPQVETILISPGDEPILIPYVPFHLYQILFELIKNSMRAVVENNKIAMPKIRIIISRGEEDITIKIMDEGKGIPRRAIKNLFTYMYSTAAPPSLEDTFSGDTNSAPLAGFGYGLPISRLHAKYFGGDLQVISTEGYGTDAYVYLNVNPMDSLEMLPSFNHRGVHSLNKIANSTRH